jgi:formylglycine-generating enzyme required for sulfatase activity
MQRWFLSYNSQDLALMQEFESALRRRDASAKIFFAPKSIRAGGFWLPEIAREIAEASAFVLLVGEKRLGAWQATEYYEALDRHVKDPNFPVILVLLDGQTAPGLPFLRQLHWIVTADPASDKCLAEVSEAAAGGGGLPREPWRYTAPYRGLSAMEEKDSDYFSGRGRETVDVIRALETARDKLPVLLGNSGVGKSSLAQAGVLASLARQAWPETVADAGAWPPAFSDSRRWCILKLRPGSEPLRALIEPFLRVWQFDPTDPRLETRQGEWIENLIEGRNTLKGLLDATEGRLQEIGQPKPPTFLLYIDQGEELYGRSEERQSRRFSELLAQGLTDPRLRALMSLRADFLGELQSDEALYEIHRKIDIPPLREIQLHEVVSRPAELLSARFETDLLAGHIARQTAEESAKEAGALPLLSYLLDDMWTKMIGRGDGVLRLPAPTFDLGGVLIDRANAFLARHPESEDRIRRIFTLKLATLREDGEPTRRLALRSEFSDDEWRLVSELADHPNRLLVIATPEGGRIYAEIAHEAIFRRWNKLREWMAAGREFLAWKSGLESARRVWEATPIVSKDDALLMGFALAQAQGWLAKRAEDLPDAEREFIGLSIAREKKARGRARRAQALVYVLLVGIIAGLVGWNNQSSLKERANWFITMRPYMLASVRPYVLTAEAERALKPGTSFRECAKDCPQMIVVPAGQFKLGSPLTETGRYDDEGPQNEVTIPTPFAVSKFDVTFADWDACALVGGCPRISDSDMGRGTKPVINVTLDDAQQYAAWFSKMTGEPYRLLTEAEWEYAARAGATTVYFWGDEIGKGNANCVGCGNQQDGNGTAPVGSFAANQFGLYDMAGNAWQWVQDCFHSDYDGAPVDGSAWTSVNCSVNVVRGGSWVDGPRALRSANRSRSSTVNRSYNLGFRVARTLSSSTNAITGTH